MHQPESMFSFMHGCVRMYTTCDVCGTQQDLAACAELMMHQDTKGVAILSKTAVQWILMHLIALKRSGLLVRPKKFTNERHGLSIQAFNLKARS